MLEPNTRLDLNYPDNNLVHCIQRLRRRSILVHQVRDLVAEPLTPAEYLRRPLVRRSRWLIHAWDIDCQAWRKFYLGSSREFESPGLLRLALYEPYGRQPYELLTRAFQPTFRDRRILAKVLAELNRIDHGELKLRVIADDHCVIA